MYRRLENNWAKLIWCELKLEGFFVEEAPTFLESGMVSVDLESHEDHQSDHGHTGNQTDQNKTSMHLFLLFLFVFSLGMWNCLYE